MIKRLRPAYSPEQLINIYGKRYDHASWEEHRRRVVVTVGLGSAMQPSHAPHEVADLSCGDAMIANALGILPILGDITPGYRYQGPIEETIDQIPFVDLFILSETLEHLDDPDLVLEKIRRKARRLLLSTPVHTTDQLDDNQEHYWQWDMADVVDMLNRNGWTSDHRMLLGGPRWYYNYAIMGCS